MAHTTKNCMFPFHVRRRVVRISLLPILPNPLTSTRYNDYLQLSPKSEWYVETNNGDPRSLAIFIFLCEVWVLLRPARREFSFSFLYLAGLFPQDTFSLTAIQIQQSSFGDDTCVNSYKLLLRNTSFQESKIWFSKTFWVDRYLLHTACMRVYSSYLCTNP